MRDKKSNLVSRSAYLAWKSRLSGVVCASLLLATHLTFAAELPDAAGLLRKADELRTVNYTQFVSILQSLEAARDGLSAPEHDYLRYLEAWKIAYDGDAATAVARLDTLADGPVDTTVRLRAGITAVSVLAVSKRYEEAYTRLSHVLSLLTQVSDKVARQQALSVAAQLYTEVGQIPLALSYAQTVIEEDWAGRGVCEGGAFKETALYEGGRLKSVTAELQRAFEACGKKGEVVFANGIEIVIAKIWIDQRKYDDAIQTLQGHYDEVKATHNPRMLATFDSLLADAYRRKGVPTLARQFASNVISTPVREFDPALVTAYRVLYEIAKEQGDFKSALAFHEQYAAADKAYLDDLSARHLAYQRVNHENIANKLQVDALNKQNHVLQLEGELTSQQVVTSRLYIVLLTMTVVFIGLWAYRTKRLQLHFQTLSRLDGLTGICNRPHFIEQAEKALEASRRSREQLCIVLFDLDHFKSINDRFGHATGDFVLKRAVSASKVHLARGEIFGRFGGEEFAIVLPGCGPEEARQRAEQVRVTIAGIAAYQGATKATVSASFGIAANSSSGLELGQLLAHADAALYEAKRMGRNRIVVYSHAPMGDTPSLAIVSTTGEFVQYSGRSSGGG